MSVLLQTNLPLPLFRHGKVRDVYDLGNKLLIVSTDRISAFDVVLPCGIPDKGKVLNQLSAFWFEKTAHIIPNHLIKVVDNSDALRDVIASAPTAIARAKSPKQSQKGDSSLTLGTGLVGRSMIVAKSTRIPVECVIRGYLSGSAWAEYKETGRVGNIHLPSGLQESQELPKPVFTPTTKSDTEHDRPLNDEDIKNLGIKDLIGELEERSLLIYHHARDYAKPRGIIIADTKFEFGLINGQLALIDELLTPDSSRFWDTGQYKVGCSQPSFDKQPVRDWLLASGWDKETPPPVLPQEVIEGTSKRYREAFSKLTGKVLDEN
jgi:phosphoribosylaminoimidazole-succinocarboxamide synthase